MLVVSSCKALTGTPYSIGTMIAGPYGLKESSTGLDGTTLGYNLVYRSANACTQLACAVGIFGERSPASDSALKQ